MGQLRFEDVDIEPLAAGIAFARGAFRLAFRGTGPRRRGRSTLLLRQQPDGWCIAVTTSLLVGRVTVSAQPSGRPGGTIPALCP